MQVRTCVARTLERLEHTLQELRQILTHTPKGLPIAFLYSLWDGRNSWPSSERGARKAFFRRPSHSEAFTVSTYIMGLRSDIISIENTPLHVQGSI